MQLMLSLGNLKLGDQLFQAGGRFFQNVCGLTDGFGGLAGFLGTLGDFLRAGSALRDSVGYRLFDSLVDLGDFFHYLL